MNRHPIHVLASSLRPNGGWEEHSDRQLASVDELDLQDPATPEKARSAEGWAIGVGVRWRRDSAFVTALDAEAAQ